MSWTHELSLEEINTINNILSTYGQRGLVTDFTMRQIDVRNLGMPEYEQHELSLTTLWTLQRIYAHVYGEIPTVFDIGVIDYNIYNPRAIIQAGFVQGDNWKYLSFQQLGDLFIIYGIDPVWAYNDDKREDGLTLIRSMQNSHMRELLLRDVFKHNDSNTPHLFARSLIDRNADI